MYYEEKLQMQPEEEPTSSSPKNLSLGIMTHTQKEHGQLVPYKFHN